MPPLDPNLGELRSVHKPVKWRLWLMLTFSLAPLFMLVLGIVIIFDDLTHNRTASLGKTPIACLGVVGLLFVLLMVLFAGEFRKWYPTRNARLRIFENGFTYEDQKQQHACRWNEIRDITHRSLTVHSKSSATRRVRVIRSIVRTDGTVIEVAESFNLHTLTPLITAGRKSADY